MFLSFRGSERFLYSQSDLILCRFVLNEYYLWFTNVDSDGVLENKYYMINIRSRI